MLLSKKILTYIWELINMLKYLKPIYPLSSSLLIKLIGLDCLDGLDKGFYGIIQINRNDENNIRTI